MIRKPIKRCLIVMLLFLMVSSNLLSVSATPVEEGTSTSEEVQGEASNEGEGENEATGVEESPQPDQQQDQQQPQLPSNNDKIVQSQEFLKENSWRFNDGKPLDTEESSGMEPRTSSKAYHPNSTRTGIDVSEHNGVIDWERVKNAGIDYAIIRCGYGNNSSSQDDDYWLRNVAECERLGIPYGVYIYSYALDTNEARSEAEHVLRLITGRSLSYPVYFDMEDSSTIGTDYAAIAETFCNIISGAGYPVGVYANLNWWNNYLTDARFSRWYRWVAQYNTSCGYGGTYAMWQYSSKGRVDGMNGNVDMNYLIGYPADHGIQFVGPFIDVRFTDWYGNDIFFVYNAKIMTGLTPNRFGPTDILGRGQFVTTLWRIAGQPSVDYSETFSDIPPNQFYTQAVLWASQNNIVSGYGNGKFGPNDTITREQVATILHSYAKHKKHDTSTDKDLSGFPDGGSVSEFAKDAKKWAVHTGLIRGKSGGRLEPQGATSRAECAVILKRFMQPFGDVGHSDWYGSAVAFNYYSGYMTGLNESSFGPSDYLARGQFATILHRMDQEPAVIYEDRFADVGKGEFYTDAVLWASDKNVGVVTGYANGNFGPADRVTREQIAVMLYRYAKYKGYDISEKANLDTYRDVSSITSFAKDAMEWAVGAGVISGKDNNTLLQPHLTASRAESAIMIMRFVQKYR